MTEIRSTVLIETLWNVKKYNAEITTLMNTVLIETLWNVKLLSRRVERVPVYVLIETLWNVKEAVHNNAWIRHGINRNIVECKDGSPASGKGTGQGINRNIVECKESKIKEIARNEYVLIETLWNVKTQSRR